MMAKRVLGAVSLAMGIAVLAWFAYSLVWPTREFQRSFGSVFQLIMPAAMIWYGWRWVTDAGPGIETLQIDPEAPELAASMVQARRTMPAFLEAVRRHEDGAYIEHVERKGIHLNRTMRKQRAQFVDATDQAKPALPLRPR